MDAFDITASALTAQRLRLDTISSNLANVNSTRGPNGEKGAYRRKNVVFAPILNEAMNPRGSATGKLAHTIAMKPSTSGISIGADGQMILKAGITHLDSSSNNGGTGVRVMEITEDTETPMRQVYDPSHPDADKDGYVELPNVNVVTEMVDMISATRAYEANVTALQSAKSMMQSALEI